MATKLQKLSRVIVKIKSDLDTLRSCFESEEGTTNEQKKQRDESYQIFRGNVLYATNLDVLYFKTNESSQHILELWGSLKDSIDNFYYNTVDKSSRTKGALDALISNDALTQIPTLVQEYIGS